jgi:hypothetical protein
VGSKSAFLTFGRQLCCRPKAKMGCALHLQPATDQCYEPLSEALLKCSGWGELTRVVATCLKWRNKKQGIINPVEIWRQEAIMGLSQSQCTFTGAAAIECASEQGNTLAPLAPFLDERRLIRLGGRKGAAHLNYDAKYPLLLHQRDLLTTTLARFIHLRLEHSGGLRAVVAVLNKRSSMLFQKIAYGCIPCRKRLAKPRQQKNK